MLILIVWTAVVIGYVNSVQSEVASRSQTVTYTTTTTSFVVTNTTLSLVDPTRFKLQILPINPTNRTVGLEINAELQYSLLGGGQASSPFIGFIAGPLYYGLPSSPPPSPQIEAMSINGTIRDTSGTGNSKLVIIDAETQKILATFPVTAPGGTIPFNYNFPATLTTAVMTNPIQVVSIVVANVTPYSISVEGSVWPFNLVFLGENFWIKVTFNELFAQVRKTFSAKIQCFPPRGNNFTVLEKTTSLPLRFDANSLTIPESESITANVSGDWHILVEPEITIGNETIPPTALLLSISVQPWVVWEFWLMLAAVIVAVPAGVLGWIWRIIRRK